MTIIVVHVVVVIVVVVAVATVVRGPGCAESDTESRGAVTVRRGGISIFPGPSTDYCRGL